MKDIVSYETSLKLKTAGFPQPELQKGQVWWRSENWFELVSYADDGDIYYYMDGSGHSMIKSLSDFNGVFAPTVTDVLREMGADWLIGNYGNEWGVLQYHGGEFKYDGCMHENPAEAAALAYLKIRRT